MEENKKKEINDKERSLRSRHIRRKIQHFHFGLFKQKDWRENQNLLTRDQCFSTLFPRNPEVLVILHWIPQEKTFSFWVVQTKNLERKPNPID